ncbi:MAG: helix-turn-helix domain-containing protein [Lachnospiraceae bacterium]|nr:helix-turn-helix domain-containing protein [Lachnospiraceae bacterium]
MIDNYITVKDTAKKWGITPRTVQILCSQGKIEGVAKFGNVWAIPTNAEKPADNRVTTGQYRNWRKKTKQATGNEAVMEADSLS